MPDADLSGSPFETRDPRFDAITNQSVKLERLATGCRWAEGPAYFPAGRHLVRSEIPNDRMLRWDECDGSTSTFRAPAGYTNGHTVDRQRPTGHRAPHLGTRRHLPGRWAWDPAAATNPPADEPDWGP